MNNEHTRRVYELSFYPHAYCIGRIPAETKLDPKESTDEMIKATGVPERFGNLIKLRSPKRDSHILDDKARRKLLEAFDISLTEELLKRVDKLSPTELEAMRDGG